MTDVLGVIDYINMLPVTYAIERGKVDFGWDISKGVPSKINSMISKGEVDAGFISSIEYARGKYKLLPYSIGSDGEVMSVALSSMRTLKNIGSVRLTSESATSSALLKILMKFAYGKDMTYSEEASDADLLIGNSALRAYEDGTQVLDLGKSWKDFSSSKMVFGVLATRKNLPDEKVGEIVGYIDRSRSWCKKNMDEIVSSAKNSTGIGADLIRRYYSRLSYTMGFDDLHGLEKFYGYAKKIGEIEKMPELVVHDGH